MKRKTIRSFCAILSIICILSLLPIQAIAAQKPTDSPQYTGISTISANLDISTSGYATCSGATRGNTGYTVELVVQLKRDGTTIKTWRESGTGFHNITEGYYVTKGHNYQVVTTVNVRNSAGTLVSTPSVSTSLKSN